MNWYILVVMMGIYADGTQDTYVYTEPTLPSLEACQQYVYVESNNIRREMMIEFDGKPIERVFCIEEEKLKQFFQIMDGGTEA